jgi:hypothetical protein
MRLVTAGAGQRVRRFHQLYMRVSADSDDVVHWAMYSPHKELSSIHGQIRRSGATRGGDGEEGANVDLP